jgi:hypothetical protein
VKKEKSLVPRLVPRILQELKVSSIEHDWYTVHIVCKSMGLTSLSMIQQKLLQQLGSFRVGRG